jgi:hypothetical protein
MPIVRPDMRRKLRVTLAILGVFGLMAGGVALKQLQYRRMTQAMERMNVEPPPEPEPVVTSAAPAVPVCPAPAGPVTPTQPDAATTARIDAAWARIEAWLAKKPPSDAAALGRPASNAQIDALQRRMGVAFPGDLVASLRRHNGGEFALPPFYSSMSLDEIRRDRELNCSVYEDAGEPGIWLAGYVPFGAAPDGGSLLLDAGGRVGEHFAEDGTHFEGWPDSLAGLLTGIAGSLETGRKYLDSLPYVEGGRLDWALAQ